MNLEQWTAVDRFFTDVLSPADAALEAAQRASEAAGLPAIAVSPAQGALLHVLARALGARSILEIGTLGGYSAIWLARALPADGRLVTLEAEPRHADVARANLARAGLADRVDLRLGPALAALAQLAAEGAGPFDLVFIDADKQSIPEYWEWALRLARPGTLIVVDNVVRRGAVVEADSEDPSVQGVRRFRERVAGEARVRASVVQTVGAKGWDGFVMAVVIAAPAVSRA